MDYLKKFLIILAIFCVIGSAAAVSADDIGLHDSTNAEYKYDDMNVVSGSQYNPDDQGLGQDAAVEHDTSFVPDGNPEVPIPEGNNTGHAAGEPDTQAAQNQTASNATATDTPAETQASENLNMTNGTGNATSSHGMLATGNPILALLAVGAVLGSVAVIKRK